VNAVGPHIQGNPRDLVLQPEDLPGRFAISKGDHGQVGEYSHVYFNPQALTDPSAAGQEILGVIVNLTLLQDSLAAHQRFTDQGGLDVNSVTSSIQAQQPQATPLQVQEYSIELPGTSRVLGFRLHYVAEGAHVYEYRCRFVLGNALCNLIISSGADQKEQEPEQFAQTARAIIDRQMMRLRSAGS